MKKATTHAAAKTLMTGAKIAKIGQIEAAPTKKTSGIYPAFTIGSADLNPMDWNELDSLMSKPPKTERKPKKAAYNKPEEVKKMEAETGRKYRDDTANGLTRLIIDHIKLHGGQAERVNSMGVPLDKRRLVTDILGRSRMIGSVEWRRSGGTMGSADISATVKGKAVKIEVKIGHDRQSPAQKEYQRQVEQAGGLYFIAKDFTAFVQWYRQTF